jgi:glycosyltransferase involved in cell wall biosynthesis
MCPLAQSPRAPPQGSFSDERIGRRAKSPKGSDSGPGGVVARMPVLMLVSAAADARLRQEVAEHVRPRPEYLLLEAGHGVELLDWSRLPGPSRGRSGWRSALHVAAALRALDHHDVVFSDGEHVGIPLALALRAFGIATPHLVIGHHLTTRAKAPLIRNLRAHQGMTRILVHSSHQRDLAHRELGIPAAKLDYVPYYADTEFWCPTNVGEEALVVAAGREHRDYATLAEACGGLRARVFVAAGSVHSPAATSRNPVEWPGNFEQGFADYRKLRDLYGRASVVVVPLVETDFQAGVTTVLEAMAMGKAVVVTATRGQSEVVRDGLTGITVPPGDAEQLRDAIRYLLESPAERRRLGWAAREAVVCGFSLEAYGERLAAHLADLALANRAAA